MSVPVPSSVSVFDLTGSWTLNTEATDNVKDVLTKVNYSEKHVQMVESRIPTAVEIKHHKDAKGAEILDITQTTAAGTVTQEKRIFDGTSRNVSSNKSMVSGIIGEHTLAATGQRTGGSSGQELHHVIMSDKTIIIGMAKPTCDKNWSINATWTITESSGTKQLVRKIHVKDIKDQEIDATLVYDYAGPPKN